MPVEVVPTGFLRADSIKTTAELQKADFLTKALFASAAAWSPNPGNPPFHVDLPVRNGKLQPQILQVGCKSALKQFGSIHL
jgi:S-formylglutathione hydrolase